MAFKIGDRVSFSWAETNDSGKWVEYKWAGTVVEIVNPRVTPTLAEVKVRWDSGMVENIITGLLVRE